MEMKMARGRFLQNDHRSYGRHWQMSANRGEATFWFSVMALDTIRVQLKHDYKISMFTIVYTPFPTDHSFLRLAQNMQHVPHQVQN